ncbi:MAG: hypothetical protein HY078_15190 [Elusimicrobia bacterium]|nr:hypothetical protein [Elusimicrobiota bacterium]
MAETQYRIRIKLENGSEMEATGSLEYVRGEREAFLAHFGQGARPDIRPESGVQEPEIEPAETPAESRQSPPTTPFSPRHHRHAPPLPATDSDPYALREDAESDGGAQRGSRAAGIRSPIWDSVIEVGPGPSIQLRAKLQNDKTDRDACLLLLMAAQKVLNLQKPTAAQLARWLRASGYPIQRVDRVLSDAIDKGEIMASGSRRARRYELTAPGRVKGFLLAQQMTQRVHGTDRGDDL